jgi:hypothetical protein
MIGGMFLIHCVAEDAFYLLVGMVEGLMKDYFSSNITSSAAEKLDKEGEKGQRGIKIDAAVFTGLLAGSEKGLSRKFKDLGIHRMSSHFTASHPCFVTWSVIRYLLSS